MPEPLVGASVFDQRLYDHVSSHVENEVEALQGYATLAESTESKAFKFLAELILEDERKHHRMLSDLAQTIKVSAGASREPAQLPFLDLHKDREAILAATEKLLAIEQEDQEKLKKLAREVKDFRDTTLWELVLKIMEADNSKHRMILKFVRDHARHPR